MNALQTAARADLAQAQAVAKSQSQEARAAFLHGCQEFGERRDGRASAEYERALKLEPQNPVYHYWLGRAYGSQAQGASLFRQPGLAKRTKEHFERAVALDSTYLDARAGLVQYYLQAPSIAGGSVDKARAQAAEIARVNPYRGAFELANVALKAKDSATVTRSYEELVSAFADSAGAHQTLVNWLILRKQWPGAWKAVDQMERRFPQLPSARYTVGRTAAESGEQLARGEQGLRDYLAHMPAPNEPPLASAHWRLGMVKEKQGDRAGARGEYEAALQLDPKHKPAKDALARLK